MKDLKDVSAYRFWASPELGRDGLGPELEEPVWIEIGLRGKPMPLGPNLGQRIVRIRCID